MMALPNWVREQQFPREVTIKELQIGDTIRVGLNADHGYHDCTVYNVEHGTVYVVRPYVHVSDFVTSGGVITYLGEEKFSMSVDSSAMVRLLSRRDPEETHKKVRAIIAEVEQHIIAGNAALALNSLHKL
jgi:hypothetical protein